MTEALREEMIAAKRPVKVTAVQPGWHQDCDRAQRGGRREHRPRRSSRRSSTRSSPRTTPEKAAKVILDAVRKDKARVLVGADAKALDIIVRITGSGYQRLFASVIARAMPGVR